MNRREYLRAAGAVGLTLLAGCTGGGETPTPTDTPTDTPTPTEAPTETATSTPTPVQGFTGSVEFPDCQSVLVSEGPFESISLVLANGESPTYSEGYQDATVFDEDARIIEAIVRADGERYTYGGPEDCGPTETPTETGTPTETPTEEPTPDPADDIYIENEYLEEGDGEVIVYWTARNGGSERIRAELDISFIAASGTAVAEEHSSPSLGVGEQRDNQRTYDGEHVSDVVDYEIVVTDAETPPFTR